LVVFFNGQGVALEAQQHAGLLAQAFFVTGQVLIIGQGLWHDFALEAQPVNPRAATPTTERRVRIDFITGGI
jgi:hypothetical protein